MGMGLQANPKLGSLFDGSGGFPLAGALCGIEPVWASEVEPYPIAVTRARFPNMKHLGDISKINGVEIEPVDIITFGSPCQDLSVAGKRAGLKHESNGDEETTRSGLFMEAVRIIKEMRDATNGVLPRFALWENVPGAFSSNKGEDFRIVLEELIKIAEPAAVMPPVPEKGWAYADSYSGDGWSIAYRVFDAQYWGVPQRRRRIHLVVDFRGQCAGEVLFKSEGMRGYSAESGTQGEGTSADAQGSSGAADREGAIPYTLKIRSGCEGGGKGALIQTDKSATLATNNDQYLFQPVAYGISSYHSNGMKSDNPHSGIYVAETARTLDAMNCGYPACNQGGIAVVEALSCIDGDKIGKAERSGGSGLGIRDGDKMYTLTAKDAGTHGVCIRSYQKVTGPLMANSHPGSYTGQDAFSDMLVVDKEEKPIVLDRAFYNQGQNAQYDPQFYQDGTVPTIVAKGPSAVCHKQEIRYIVRRLTPTECARLQGFPDYWGHFPEKDSMTDEEYHFWLEVRNTHARINGKPEKDYTKAQMLTWYNKLHTDSAEYKMWGNGIALPPALYCMQGIVEALTNQKTK